MFFFSGASVWGFHFSEELLLCGERSEFVCVCVVFPVPRAAGDRPTLSCGGSRKMLPRAELQQRRAPRKDIFLLPLTGQCILTATLLEETAASLVLMAVAASDFQVDLIRKLCSYHTALPRIVCLKLCCA